jgi:methionyl-tRNA formyltransferase
MSSVDEAMDELLPRLKKGILMYSVQDDAKATYLGKRAPSDGYIEWKESAVKIERLVRAVSRPLPGAFTFLGNREIKIWKSRVWSIENIIGVPGRILRILENSFVVCTGDEHLEVQEWEGVELNDLMEGQMLGINWVTLYRKIIANG